MFNITEKGLYAGIGSEKLINGEVVLQANIWRGGSRFDLNEEYDVRLCSYLPRVTFLSFPIVQSSESNSLHSSGSLNVLLTIDRPEIGAFIGQYESLQSVSFHESDGTFADQ